MPSLTREQERNLEVSILTGLRLAKHNNPEVAGLLRLLSLRLERHKASLVKCGPGEFQSIQGEARALDRLINDISEEVTAKKEA